MYGYTITNMHATSDFIQVLLFPSTLHQQRMPVGWFKFPATNFCLVNKVDYCIVYLYNDDLYAI